MGNVLVVHSTEGSTIAGAVTTMRKNNSLSHRICDPATKESQKLLAWSRPARSLRNQAGGVETNNRDGVFQLEVVGRAEHIPTYPDEWHRWLADYIRDICAEIDVPLVAPRPFITYPDSYGIRGPARMSYAEWNNTAGIVGHQHVPENTHGDPGDISRTLAYLTGDTAPMPTTVETEVKYWQTFLNELGAEPPLKVDGDRGPKTEAAAATHGARFRSFETELAERIAMAAAQAERITAFESAAQTNAAVLAATQTTLAETKAELAATAEALARLETQVDDELSEPPDIDPAIARKAKRHDQLAQLIYAAVVEARAAGVNRTEPPTPAGDPS